MENDTHVDATCVDDDTPPDADVVGDAPAEASPAPARATSQELERAVTRPAGSTALIVADTAAQKRDIAAEIATTLDDVIKTQGLRTKMGRMKKVGPDGRETFVDRYHVNVEGWQTLATFLDLAVVPVWTRQVIDPETGHPRRVTFPVKVTRTKNRGKPNEITTTEEYEVDGYDWEARVEVFKDGNLIAAAEAMVTRAEDSWKTRDDHSCRSMAQTRATGKAIAGAARWIVALAGYSATPAEEMPTPANGDDAPPPAPELPTWTQHANDDRKREFVVALESMGIDTRDVRLIMKAIAEKFGAFPNILVVLAKAIAAKHPDASDVTEQAKAAETAPPAGTVYIDGESAPDNASVSFVKLDEAERLCSCPGGFAAAEKEGPTKGRVDDACPIRNHGIPF